MRGADSFVEMIRERALQKRHKLIEQLPVTGELLRGTLLNRIVRHKSGCPKCERGEGHAVSVLTVSYAGGRTQQFSVRRERRPHRDAVHWRDPARRNTGDHRRTNRDAAR